MWAPSAIDPIYYTWVSRTSKLRDVATGSLPSCIFQTTTFARESCASGQNLDPPLYPLVMKVSITPRLLTLSSSGLPSSLYYLRPSPEWLCYIHIRPPSPSLPLSPPHHLCSSPTTNVLCFASYTATCSTIHPEAKSWRRGEGEPSRSLFLPSQSQFPSPSSPKTPSTPPPTVAATRRKKRSITAVCLLRPQYRLRVPEPLWSLILCLRQVFHDF